MDSVPPVRLLILPVLSIFGGLILASRFPNDKRISGRAALNRFWLGLCWLGLLRFWLTFYFTDSWSWWL
jgi:hypothetical protein